VGREKVAALGVRITRHITMHGFALNVCVNLKDYGGIVPCGISDRGVTSLDKLAPGVSLDEARSRVVHRFMEVFGYESRLNVTE
jgi:lipoyl(octanoyl) transferase